MTDQPRVQERSLAPILILLVVGLATIAAGFMFLRLQSQPAELVGSTLAPSEKPAPDFRLTDQFGQAVALSDFKGKPIALTFIYTNCPDICPIIATNFHITYQQLGDDASDVALLAVTVDPERDGIEQIRRFSDQRRLTDEWHFLTGTRPQLEQVWKDYGIYSQAVDAEGIPVTPTTGGPSPAELEHSAPIFMIDKQGHTRAMLPFDFQAEDLLTNFRVLLNE